MRVLLATQGSTGDIVPLLALGEALRVAGHEATLSTVEFYREEAESRGLGFLPSEPDWRQEDFAEMMAVLRDANDPLKQVCEIYRRCRPFLRQWIQQLDAALQTHDILVASYLFPVLYGVAQRQKRPFALVAFCHNVVPSDQYPPSILPSLGVFPQSWQRAYHRFLWSSGEKFVARALHRQIHDILEAEKLPPAPGLFSPPVDPILMAVSPGLFVEACPGGDPRYKFTGYLRTQAAFDPAQEAILHEYTGGRPCPLLTFGSVNSRQMKERFDQFIRAWPNGCKLIVQSGWAGLAAERDDVLLVGKMSHDQLFAHASVLCHHGGAGTTASALHAGVRQIIVPHIADQDFWGSEMKRLGVGRVVPEKQWAKHLQRAIEAAEADEAARAKALELASIVAEEDGKTAAVKELEKLL